MSMMIYLNVLGKQLYTRIFSAGIGRIPPHRPYTPPHFRIQRQWRPPNGGAKRSLSTWKRTTRKRQSPWNIPSQIFPRTFPIPANWRRFRCQFWVVCSHSIPRHCDNWLSSKSRWKLIKCLQNNFSQEKRQTFWQKQSQRISSRKEIRLLQSVPKQIRSVAPSCGIPSPRKPKMNDSAQL